MTPMVEPERARQLVLEHGWNSTAYQILNPGIEHWFCQTSPGVVGFVREHRRWIAGGSPICAPELLPAICGEFESAAAEHGCRVCYFCAAARMEQMYRHSTRHSVITIGAQPVWDPHDWPERVCGHPSVRAQLNRARNKGVVILQWQAERARTDPGLRQCLADWLAHRAFPPLHFMTEPDTLDGVLRDRLLFVAVREEQAVGYLLASPAPRRNGYLLEQIVRSRQAPNGTAELLIHAAMHRLAEMDCTYATLGLVALAEHARRHMARNPLWMRVMLAWARAHGCRFYNFQGLEAFRTKLHPQAWEPVFAISNEQNFSAMTLHAVAKAFCEGSPVVALGRALTKALRQEAEWLREKFFR